MTTSHRPWSLGLALALLACCALGVRADDTPVPSGDASAATDNAQPAKVVADDEATDVESQAENAQADLKDEPEADEDAEVEVDTDEPLNVEMFQAMEDGVLEVKYIGRSDREARVIFTNLTKRPLSVQLPEAFAGVPVLAQFGGGGGGRGGGGFGGGGGGGGQQSSGGGFGGGGGGGGGGGLFNIAPERTTKVDVATVCLDHGLRDPSSSKPYQIVPIDEKVKRPAVVELLKALGRGELHHGAAQAAVWHLNNDLTWQQLAAKRGGSQRQLRRPPYFSRHELEAAYAYSQEAIRRGQQYSPDESSDVQDAEYERYLSEKEQYEAQQDEPQEAENAGP